MKHHTKIFYMGRQINGRFDSFKAKVRRFINQMVRVGTIMAVLAGVFFIGAVTFSTTSVTAHSNTVQLPVVSPVLDRIADCESGDAGKPGTATHIDPKTGQVLVRANKNGSVDIGKYQINEYYWGKKATQLGLELTKEEDNRKMAEWIYLNKGTTDWSASQKCWYK